MLAPRLQGRLSGDAGFWGHCAVGGNGQPWCSEPCLVPGTFLGCRSHPGTGPLQGLSKNQERLKVHESVLPEDHISSPAQRGGAAGTPRALSAHLKLPVLVAVHQTPAPAHPFSSKERRFLQKCPLLGLSDVVVVYSCWLGCVCVLLYVTNALCICHSNLQQPVASATHVWCS